MLINIGAEFGTHLESSDIATELVDILNKIPEDEFILDFKEVIFITMNFAQAYYMAKLESSKKISEINLSDSIKVTMGAADEAVNP
ncbi:hypothetical protein [Methanobrevibacter sp.]|uniref:hypothetical protein n=1 Tax=Methanobrevibacter sp. TaxID=66852 RepID=UPI00388E807F